MKALWLTTRDQLSLEDIPRFRRHFYFLLLLALSAVLAQTLCRCLTDVSTEPAVIRGREELRRLPSVTVHEKLPEP